MKVPRFVYKYQAFSVRTLEMLSCNNVWFSDPGVLNDPFELNQDYRQVLNTVVSREEFLRIRKAVKGYASHHEIPISHVPESGDYDHQALLDELLQELIIPMWWKRIGVYSTSGVANHQLLWAHYADGHKGFAIEYDTSQELHYDGLRTMPIVYSDDYPLVSIENFISQPSQVIIELASRKGRSWEYEQEWRIISQEANVERQFPWKVSSLIFGCRMSARKRNLLRTICNLDVEFKEVSPLPGTCEMEINQA